MLTVATVVSVLVLLVMVICSVKLHKDLNKY